MLGKLISESEVKFIPKSQFKKKCLSWEDFQQKASEAGVKIFDTRDSVQKGLGSNGKALALTAAEKLQLEDFQAQNTEMIQALGGRVVISQTFDMFKKFIIKNHRYSQYTLLIFDQVGKQVQWLMYHLEQAGLTNYYFLDKGAYGVIGSQPYGKK